MYIIVNIYIPLIEQNHYFVADYKSFTQLLTFIFLFLQCNRISYPSSEKVSSLWDSSGEVFSVVFFDTVTPLIVTEVGSPISKVAGTAGGGALGLWRGVGPTLWEDRPAEAATDDGLLTLGGGCGGLKIMFVLLINQWYRLWQYRLWSFQTGVHNQNTVQSK